MNLRVRTDNTFLTSTLTVSKVIQQSLRFSCKVAAICDYNNMFGVAEFYYNCLKNHLKPVIGVELSVDFLEGDISTILLFAQNTTGYQNLVTLTSLVNRYNVQALTIKELSQYHQGLTAVIPSDQPFLLKRLENNQIYEMNEWMHTLQSIYNKIYFGVYRHRNGNHDQIQFLKELFLNQGILSLAMQTAYHLNEKDTLIVNLLDCIKNQTKANKEFLKNYAIVDAYFKNENELRIMYDQEELEHLQQMVSELHVQIPTLPFDLPKPYPSHQDPVELIQNACLQRLKQLNLENEEYLNRFNMELSVIMKMGFVDYFLIVADYVNYAKTHDIMVGPARGSAASSLVAYLLNITTIDPIQHHLFFERFLNIARVSMPDIDIDFLDIKRDQIIEYLKEKYGYVHVSHIVTYSTLGAKSAIRDIARIMQYSNEDVEYLLSFYPKDNREGSSLKQAYQEVASFREIVDRHQKFKQLVSFASQIEGLKRQSGMHAAGVVLYRHPLFQMVPTFEVDSHTLVTQYDYKYIEKIGLIKMDILGLKNLTLIDYCLKSINEMYHTDYTIENYNYDNREVYEFLSTGNTLGIFQLESEGMKRTIQELKPTCFEDIVSLLALYRPGPMQNIHSFILRKHGKEKITYLHDDLKDILSNTYGIILYQEQIMQIAQKIAHYTLSEADLFRRAIGKKDLKEMQHQKNIFIDRSIINGYSRELAEKLFDLIVRFADYGFNKAHSVAYAKIAVTMAAMKYQYPAIFYATLLNISDDSDSKKIAVINEAKYFNIGFLAPNINESFYTFSLKGNQLLFGLANIRTLKNKIAEDILNERQKGLFVDIYDFMIRMIKINLSMNNMEALIYSGALDCFHLARELLINNLLTLYEYGKMFIDLPYQMGDYVHYDYLPVPLFINKPMDIDILDKEKEYLGMYLSRHPLTLIKEKYAQQVIDIDQIQDREYDTYLIGKIHQIDLSKNKNGKAMLKIKLEDETNAIFLYAYEQTAEQFKKQFHKHEIVLAAVHVKNKKMIYVNKMRLIEEGN